MNQCKADIFSGFTQCVQQGNEKELPSTFTLIRENQAGSHGVKMLNDLHPQITREENKILFLFLQSN